jgi:hypothetical protein
MAEVVTTRQWARPADRIAEVTDPYRESLKNGPPPDLEENVSERVAGGNRREDECACQQTATGAICALSILR